MLHFPWSKKQGHWADIKGNGRRLVLDTALEITGIVLEIAIVALLSFKRVYRTLPVFYMYLVWGLASDAVMFFLQYRYPAHYLQIYLGEMSFDAMLQYAVLVELSWSVLRPYRAILPRRTLGAIPVLIVALGAIAWPLANMRGFGSFPPQWHFLAHLQASIAVLRVMFFLLIAGGSHLLSIGWRDRELQVATGLGLYSMVSLGAAIVHSYQKLGYGYHYVDVAVSASYIVSILYWTTSFLQKEVPRREFSPQMKAFFPALAGTARSHLQVMTGTTDPGSQRQL